ncbi:hypothetical protein AWH62_03180 [Maricaulis sp. W15]|nr:hypothetical protein AWH62_03180 [Maricaulis sp. W15]
MNDQLRARVGLPVFLGESEPDLGVTVMTRGVAALTPEQIIEAWMCVRSFADFTEGNDPYGERDFGGFTIECAGRLFWKIDYYADRACDSGSEDPADPDRSYRVLTIMLAEEY